MEQTGRAGDKRRSKVKKQLRRIKHKVERRAAKVDPETPPMYVKYRGYAT